MRTIIFSLLILLAFAGNSYAQTDEDKRQVLQLCIDLPALQNYYHSEQPGRSPLIIKSNDKIPVVRVSKFGQPVEFMTEDEISTSGKEAYIDFSRFEITGENATVVYRYRAEGIMMTVLLKKSGGQWVVSESKLMER
jgi:hypothetical protein